jgi:hypothetical protein
MLSFLSNSTKPAFHKQWMLGLSNGVSNKASQALIRLSCCVFLVGVYSFSTFAQTPSANEQAVTASDLARAFAYAPSVFASALASHSNHKLDVKDVSLVNTTGDGGLTCSGGGFCKAVSLTAQHSSPNAVFAAAHLGNAAYPKNGYVVSNGKLFVAEGKFCLGVEGFLANAPDNAAMLAKFPVREALPVADEVARALGFKSVTLLPSEYEPIDRNVFALRADVSFGLNVAPAPITAGKASVITFELLRDAVVSLVIYGTDGNVVRTIATKTQYAANAHPQYSWDGRTDKGEFAPAGMYSVALQVKTRAGWFSETKVVSVVRQDHALSANDIR